MLNGVDEVLRENSGRGTGSGSSSTAGGPKMVNGKREGERVLIGVIFCLNFCANFYVRSAWSCFVNNSLLCSTFMSQTIKYFSLEAVRRLQSTAILIIAALVAAAAAKAKIEIITITIITVIIVVLREPEAVAAATPTTFRQNLRGK